MNELGETKRIPQLRILATDFCESKCIYCRDSGEGNFQSTGCCISLDVATKVAAVYKQLGGMEVKITGGDPVFWHGLVKYVDVLKNKLVFPRVEVITRSTKILKLINALADAGMDMLTFSLDTLNERTYNHITGKCDFDEYINVIKMCSGVCDCKINAVMMNGINHEEYIPMVDFCSDNGLKQLKFLDLIDDINLESCDSRETRKIELKRYSIALEKMISYIRSISKSEGVIFQGGLGHPMNSFSLNNGLEIVFKDYHSGAWYSSICRNCPNYPCHDALMALRLTPQNYLQLCLVNKDMNVAFNSDNIYSVMKEVMSIYQDAFFASYTEL